MDMMAFVFVLVIEAKRLRPYFQALSMKMLTDTRFKKVLQSSDILGCLMNCVVELSKFDTKYLPCIVVKGQVLVDFVAEFANFLVEVLTTPIGKL